MSLTKASYSMITGAPVNVLDYGAVAYPYTATSGTDSYSAIMAAITAAVEHPTVNSNYGISPQVYFPPGIYFCSQTIILTSQVKLYGGGSGQGYTLCPTIQFTTAGGTGIYIQPYQLGNTGAGSIIQGLTLQGTTGTADSYGGHGIYSQTTFQIVNSSIFGFQTCGINITANTSGSGLTLGNANGWSIRDVTITANSSNSNAHGVYITGSDANAGNGYSINVTGAGGVGIYDNSFLGNTWLGCQVVSTGAAYQCTDANARSLFLGCYAEGGSGTSNVLYPSLIVGGLLGSGITTNTNWIRTNSAGFVFSTLIATETISFGYGQSNTSGIGLTFEDTQAAYPWTFAKTTGRWGYQWAGADYPEYIMFYDRNATPANGYARDISSIYSPTGSYGALGIGPHYFGSYAQMLWRGLGSAAPTSGAYIVGDIIYNTSPTAGGYIGWVCVSAGSPGTWKTFGAISS